MATVAKEFVAPNVISIDCLPQVAHRSAGVVSVPRVAELNTFHVPQYGLVVYWLDGVGHTLVMLQFVEILITSPIWKATEFAGVTVKIAPVPVPGPETVFAVTVPT